MESLSRHRHGRKHSSTRNAFSSASSPSFPLKDPYDDVSLSKGGKSNFGVHEYAEIFSGSSSIPVLDLSFLDERVGLGEFRSSGLDYSNIFGGLGNDEVAVPYEELLNGAAKKTKAEISVDAPSPCPESGSLQSSGKIKKSSGEANDQSVDGNTQQFNMSFNKTSQRDGDESDGKTHIAQLHAVPGFTCFVDGTPRSQKKEGDIPVSSLKRDVSRTWSFNVGAVDGLTNEKSHVLDKPGTVNASNLKTRIAEVPSPSSHPCNPFGENDPIGSKFPSFDPRDASKRTAGEYSMPLFDEELNENSVAAVSAAALKKAVDQAQESIRIARMRRERKRENLQGGSKPGSKGHSIVKDKNETRIDSKADDSIENSAWETHERLDTFPIFSGINGKFAPSLDHTGKFLITGKVEVERVNMKVEAQKENEDASSEAGKRFAASCSQGRTCYGLEKLASEPIETAEACQGVINFIGLASDGECSIEALDPGKVGNHNNLMCYTDKLQSHLEEMETVTRNVEQLSIHHSKGNEVVSELADRSPHASKSLQEIGKSVHDSSVQIKATVNTRKAAEDNAESSERDLHSSRSMENIVHETGVSLCVMHEGEAMKARDGVADCKVKCEKKFLEQEEMIPGEHLTARKSVFKDLLNGLRNLAEKEMLRLEDIENVSETYPERKGNDQHGQRSDEEENSVMYKGTHLWFESEQQLKDSLEEEIREMGPEIFSKVGGDGKSVNVVQEPERNVDKWNCEHDGEGHKSARKYEQYETVEKQMDASKLEVAETIRMEVNYCGEVQKDEVAWDAEETINIHGAAGQNEENEDKFNVQDTACEKGIDEALDACDNDFATKSSDDRADDTINISITSEIQEPCDVDSNDKAEEYQVAVKGCKEKCSLTGVTSALSSAEDNDVEKLFHQEVNEMPRTNSLRRCASEENFLGSSAFEGFSSDSSTENSGVVDADHLKELPRPVDMFEAASKINRIAQEEAAKIVTQHFPAEFDGTNVRLELEETLESIERTVTTSVCQASAHESQECAGNAEDNTSKKEEVKHGLDMTSDGREYVEEHREPLDSECPVEELSSPPNSEPEEIGKSAETKREVETGKTVGKDKEDLSGPSTMKQKEARGTWQKVETHDRQQRIEAIKKGREREKDRKAVERAIREVRERAFAEAREKAERAAVERAAAEARQRVMAEAQEKLEKISMESKQSADKLSTEAKIRAERAAVERATAEARGRALEKAKSLKTYTETRTQAERCSTERLSGSSWDKGLKHSFSSSDLEKFDESTSESAQRRKARLERQQRIKERAAKALAEKNKRDLLAQKEQAEKNRLAEILDGEIKRWASGKEGNLRALLSTLQYILGPDSGWQPTSLTEIITTAAVKKAYRKATLCVHPDKLQQRGATIQQKYICEKVFDLLKAAWNRFNSEEN